MKKYYSYIASLVIIIVISLAYFAPQLENKKIAGHDVRSFLGMSKEARDYNNSHDDIALWTNGLFGGMPTYQVGGVTSPGLIKYFHRILNFLGRPACFLFLYLFGAFIAFMLLGFQWHLSLIGAIAYAFSTYLFIIIEAGHNSKVLALGYMPPIVIGAYVAFNGKRLIGTAVFGLFLALQLLVNHLQITYYTLITILIFIIIHFIDVVKKKTFKDFIITSFYLAIPTFLAIGSNSTVLLTTMEYSKYSTRGSSELTLRGENKTDGLDADYIMHYCLGVDETFSFLIPNIKGGASIGSLSENSETYKLFKNSQGAVTAKKVTKQLPLYWGTQPTTSGPIYVGAIVLFLFLLGFFLVRDKKLKWWIGIVTVFSIMLSWGNNFMWFSEIFIKYFPGYDKFRSVNMTVVMASFVIPVLAIFSLRQILQNKIDKKYFFKALKYSLFILGGILIFFILFSGSIYDFSSPFDEQTFGNQQVLLDAIHKDRQSLLVNDAIRSLVLILLAAAAIYGYVKNKFKGDVLLIILGILILGDLWTVNKRVVNNDDFVPKKEAKNPFIATNADNFILQDNDPDFRVLDLTESVFNSARASYFHKSIGGYHGAKMKRYQELIEYHISGDINKLISYLRRSTSQSIVDSAFMQTKILNMLNTKYVIVNGNSQPLLNMSSYGNAWFVNSFELVNNADEEIQKLASIDPSKKALVDKRFEKELSDISAKKDSNEYIRLLDYQPNRLKYEAVANDKKMALFSEIYYPIGWQATIDGEPIDHFRANYVLRAMIIPEGSHVIEFTFKPSSYFMGNTISRISSIILVLLIFSLIAVEIKNKKGAQGEIEA